MPNPEDITTAVGAFFDANFFGKLLVYLGYTLAAVAILALIVFLYFAIQYKYKVYYPKLHFTPDGTSAQIIGLKKDFARTIRRKDGTVNQHILFMNAKVHKFDEEDIGPKNRVFVLKVHKDSGTYTPMPVIDLEKNIGEFETLSPEEKHWAILQLKENANTYKDVDAQKRILTYTFIAVVLILIACSFTAWLIMKQPARMADASVELSQSMRGFAESIRGTAPG